MILQIAIFVLPMVCLVGWAMGRPFTLDLDPLSVIILILSVIHACALCPQPSCHAGFKVLEGPRVHNVIGKRTLKL